MKHALIITAIVALSAAPSFSADAKKAPPKKQPTVKDLAVAEARKADADGNGKIQGTEASMLRGAYSKNPTGWLYLFDDNGNKILDDAEVSKISVPPKAKPAPPKPGQPKPPAKPAPPKKK